MADITTGQIFVDGEKGITAAKLNGIISQAQISTAFYTSKPIAGTADPTDQALILKAGAYAVVPISTLGGSATQAQIWSTRLRSFNAIGNPNFEVDQRNVGGSFGIIGGFGIDRWSTTKSAASYGGTVQQLSGAQVLVPGTSFVISRSYWRVTLTAAQASLGAGDFHTLSQAVEGPQWRELMGDVHSVSLMVRSSVAGLNFGLYLRDPATVTKTLTKLCTIPTANAWTLVTLPNLPLWPAGNFSVTPGVAGYTLGICLACGTTNMSPANDTWQTGSFLGAVGQSNWANSPVNSTFDLGFVQHEPGSVCSTLMDKPFSQNLEEALRYYVKSYDYDVAIGAASSPGEIGLVQQATTTLFGAVRFPKPMAKIPACLAYNYVTGTVNSCRLTNGIDYAVTAFSAGKSGFSNVTATGMPTPAAGVMGRLHYTADSGW